MQLDDYELWMIEQANRVIAAERRSRSLFHQCPRCGEDWSLDQWVTLAPAGALQLPDGGHPGFDYRVCGTERCGGLMSEAADIVEMMRETHGR